MSRRRTGSTQFRRSDFLTSDGTRTRTPWLLVVLCVLTPAIPAYVVAAGPLKSYGSLPRIITLTMCALLVAGLFQVKPRGERAIRPGVLILLTYLFVWLFLWGLGVTHLGYAGANSTVYGIGFGTTRETDDDGKNRAIMAYVFYVGIGLYAATKAIGVRNQSIVLGGLAVGLTFNNLVVLLQTVGIDFRLLLQPPGFVINTTSDGEDMTPGGGERLGVFRAFGTSTHAIEFSVISALSIILLIHFVQHGSSRGVRTLAAIGAVIALVAMPMGVSRSGVLALVASLVIVVWSWKPRFLANAIFVTTVTLVVAYGLYPNVFESLWLTIINSGDDESILTRILRYSWVGNTVRENPVFGVGLGGAGVILDNQYLQELVQGGIVGMLNVMLFIGGGLLLMNARYRLASSARERSLVLTVGAMFVGLFVTGWTFDLYAFQQATTIYFLSFGLLAAGLVLRSNDASNNLSEAGSAAKATR